MQAPLWLMEPPWQRKPLDTLSERQTELGVRFLTLNIAHGRKLSTHQALLSPRRLRENLEEIGGVLKNAAPEVVALQEADGPSIWSGNFDHVEILAELAGHSHHFRGDHNPFGGTNLTSGTALLSAYELQEIRSHRFEVSWRDTKGFVVGAVELPGWGGEVDVVSLHLEPFNPGQRRRQIHQLCEILGSRNRPLIVLGDFNCTWSEESKRLQPLARQLDLRPYQPYRKAPTYPSTRPWRRLDWILVSPELDFVDYRTLPNPVSDHLGVVATIQPR